MHANELTQLQREALSLELHQQADWRHLLQYSSGVFRPTFSEIRSATSFLASDGEHNPKSELLATINAMERLPQAGKEDEHPRCRFTARYYFLSQKLQFPQHTQSIKCARFEAWIKASDIQSVSLVFASGYFRNPASFFGHPLLKFNRHDGGSKGLLDITLNNGAVVPDNENPILYVFKGIFGGYRSAFSDTSFYQLNHSYAEDDLRDLWHYQLDLSEEEILRLIYYSWELLEHRFTYEFFGKNCGYFLENLLQYATGSRISPKNPIYSVPSSTFFNMMQDEPSDRRWVKGIWREPSRQSQFREKYISLNAAEKKALELYLNSNNLSEVLSLESRLRVIDTLTDYLESLSSRKKSKDKKSQLQKRRRDLFLARLKLAKTDDLSWPAQSSSTAPHSGSKPSLLRVSLMRTSDRTGARFRLRPVNYDFIDLDGGRAPNSKLNMFNTEITIVDGKVRLDRFDLVDIASVNISPTGLPGDGGLGWGLKFGLERPNNECLNCLVSYVGGSLLKGKQLTNRMTLYGQYEAVAHSKHLDSQLRLEANLGVLMDVTSNWRSHFKLGYRTHVSGSQDNEPVFLWENRFGTRNDRNLNLTISHERETEISLGYGIYW